MTDIKSLTYDELKKYCETLGFKSFKAGQIFAWLAKGVESFSDMTDLSLKERQALGQNAYINRLTIERKQVSKIDGTVKYLFALRDGNTVETVVMNYKHGNTICVSTEVGCKMGCAFCASTVGGLVRKLAASEMYEQVLAAQKDLGVRIDGVVLMGMGEPLDNVENVLTFLYNINNMRGLGVGMRHVSLSTCGLVPQILALAEKKLQITLSVSLHASDDATRDKIMPINKKYPIAQLLSACEKYIAVTGRRISFEYALISGVNDSEEQAEKLAKLLKGLLCHINIIPVNDVRENSFTKPDRKRVDAFCAAVEKRGIPVTVRRKLGGDIDASCGQLRRRTQTEEVEE